MPPKHLLSIYDLSAVEISNILKDAFKLKKQTKSKAFEGKTLGLIFDKPSTRTMVSFMVAMKQLGGFPMVLDANNLQRKRGESIHDTALALSQYLSGLMIRTFKHSDVEEFAAHATIPVINGLTDAEHPCQILADLMTIMELKKIKKAEGLKKFKIVFMGDSNNVANSLLAASAVLGLNFTLITPAAYAPDKKLLDKAALYARKSGAKIAITSDISKAKSADVLYTDVWVSMGDEKDAAKRQALFKPYQINSKITALAAPKCNVLHCLPAVRGAEITAEIMECYKKDIFLQAQNRLHAQKAVLAHLL